MAKKRPPTASPLNATPEQLKAMDDLQKAEEKILEDFKKGLIDYQKAVAELKAAAAKYAREAGITLQALAKRQENLTSRLGPPPPKPSNERAAEYADALAPAIGKPAYEAGRLARADAAMKKGGAAGLGGALTVAQMVIDKFTGVYEKATTGIKLLGEVAAKTASNDGMGALNAVADQAASSLEQIPIAGKHWAAAVRFAIAPINALTKVTEAYVQRAKELSQYNAPIAQQVAIAQVKGVYRDIREGQRFEKEYSELVKAQSRFEGAGNDAMMELKAAILPILPTLVDFLTLGAVAAKEMVKDTVEFKNRLLNGLDIALSQFPNMKGSLDLIKGSLTKMSNDTKVMRELQEKIDAAMKLPIDDIMDLAGRVNVGITPRDPVGEAARQRLGVPPLQR